MMDIRTSCRVLLAVLLIVSAGCRKTDEQKPVFDVSGIVLPKTINVHAGGEVTLEVIKQKGPAATDIVRLVSEASGAASDCMISNAGQDEFTFVLNQTVTTGHYTFNIVRDEESRQLGKVQINILSDVDILPEPETTVYGIVECEGKPVPGVVISDGAEVTVTDEKGIYQLVSEKENGYVFMSVPEGYNPQTDGVLPKIHQYLTESPGKQERADFILLKSPEQGNHEMLVFGDIHLASRTGDAAQFSDFTDDVNAYLTANAGKTVYGVTLGDLTWDIYWMSNGYDLNSYLTDINKIKGLVIYQTIGNHDHSCYLAGDFTSAGVYRKVIGPTNYSFNIGSVHYVVLDDIRADNTGNINDSDRGRRHYNDLIPETISWLRKDLSYVDKGTPVVVAMHAPLHDEYGNVTLDHGSELLDVLNGYDVHFMTAHTHSMYNVEGTGYYEHNSGAVCATWWWSGYETPGIHISRDGTPGGYRIVSVKGNDFSWVYKGTGKPLDHQFRTYDRNEICMTAGKYVPDGSSASRDTFSKEASEYADARTDNIVYINVWDYDPKWTISVTENEAELPVKRISAKDPLHLVSYTAKRLNKDANPTFKTNMTGHMFEVQASAPNSTLEIKITDRFGRVYTESMERPKKFDIEAYK